LRQYDRSEPLFPITQGTLPWQPIYGKIGKMTFIRQTGPVTLCVTAEWYGFETTSRSLVQRLSVSTESPHHAMDMEFRFPRRPISPVTSSEDRNFALLSVMRLLWYTRLTKRHKCRSFPGSLDFPVVLVLYLLVAEKEVLTSLTTAHILTEFVRLSADFNAI